MTFRTISLAAGLAVISMSLPHRADGRNIGYIIKELEQPGAREMERTVQNPAGPASRATVDDLKACERRLPQFLREPRDQAERVWGERARYVEKVYAMSASDLMIEERMLDRMRRAARADAGNNNPMANNSYEELTARRDLIADARLRAVVGARIDRRSNNYTAYVSAAKDWVDSSTRQQRFFIEECLIEKTGSRPAPRTATAVQPEPRAEIMGEESDRARAKRGAAPIGTETTDEEFIADLLARDAPQRVPGVAAAPRPTAPTGTPDTRAYGAPVPSFAPPAPTPRPIPPRAAANPFAEWMTGTFDSGGGLMILTPAGGTYAASNGRMTATRVDGSIMEGIWEQDSSGQQCKDGRYYGRFRLVFSETSFTGLFGYCEEPPSALGGFQGKKHMSGAFD